MLKSRMYELVYLNILYINVNVKHFPQQALCWPEGYRRFRLPDFHDIQHVKMVKLSASRTGRFYPK